MIYYLRLGNVSIADRRVESMCDGNISHVNLVPRESPVHSLLGTGRREILGTRFLSSLVASNRHKIAAKIAAS